jgi:hypothetical protein
MLFTRYDKPIECRPLFADRLEPQERQAHGRKQICHTYLGSTGYHLASAFVDQHVGHLPPATRTVILLGNTDAYMKNLRNLIGRTLGNISTINHVAYRAGDARFVHVSHPSKGTGNFDAFIKGEGKPGLKVGLASAALR